MTLHSTTDKAGYRQHLTPVASGKDGGGRIAEQIRLLPWYAGCRAICVTPARLLDQTRINALIDGKILVVPGPGFEEGFYVLPPEAVPQGRRKLATTTRGIVQFGKRLGGVEDLRGAPVSLFVTDCLAVDERGVLLGDGNGFADLAPALLGQIGCLDRAAEAVSVGDDRQLVAGQLPSDPWDLRVRAFVSGTRTHIFSESPPVGACMEIYWDSLPFKRIRKIGILWRLHHQRMPPLP